MQEFYTSVVQYGNQLSVRSIRDGLPQRFKVNFNPTLYTTSKSKTSPDEGWKSLYGVPVYEIKPGDIKDTKEFVKTYADAMEILGQTNYAYQYIHETYGSDSIQFDSELLKVVAIDIETANEESGFPEPKYAREEILLITVRDIHTKKSVTFGSRPYNGKHANEYVFCHNEEILLRSFLTHWQERYPDIVTGWNTNTFDIPYIINRIDKMYSMESKKLSPWNSVNERTIKENDKEIQTFNILGVESLDYLELYKKYSLNSVESYKLDHIAYIELGKNKLDHSKWNTFKEFYSNDWELYVDYNYVDTQLIDELDEQLKFIDQHLNIAYRARINYEEAFSPVRIWDSIIYHYLLDKKIIIPANERQHKGKLEGAYVKDPIVGFHKYVASFDLSSLYPHLIMQYNISPETLTSTRVPVTIDGLLNKMELPDTDYAIAASGWCYKRDKRGFLPELMESMYIDRSTIKKNMLTLEQEYEKDKSKTYLKREILQLDNLQTALKIILNSAYGAVSMPYFRYYDLRMAESITLSGQFAIRWIANKINRYLNTALKTENLDFIIASDTDSVYVSLEKLIQSVPNSGNTDEEKIQYMDKFCEKILSPYIDKCYVELAEYTNAFAHKMQMKREVLADKGLWVAKKRYILRVHNSEGVQYEKPKLKIMGLEIIKSSTPTIVRDKLKASIDIIFDQTNVQLIQFIETCRKEFNTFAVEDIAIPSTVNGMVKFADEKNIYSKGCPIYVRAGLLYNNQVKVNKLDQKYPLIGAGEKIKFVFLKQPNTIHENVVGFPTELPKEFNLHKYIDFDTQFEKVFIKPLENILKPIGWNTRQQSTLDDFF